MTMAEHGQRIVTAKELLILRAFVPTDKELTASLKFNPVGRIDALQLGFGETCTNGSCRAQFCAPGVCLHSHPFSNRISSADAAVCMQRSTISPDSCSLILTPLGVFTYRASPEHVAEWRVMSSDAKRSKRQQWQFIGLALQAATQRGEMDVFINKMASNGIQVSYVPWAEVERGGGVLAL